MIFKVPKDVLLYNSDRAKMKGDFCDVRDNRETRDKPIFDWSIVGNQCLDKDGVYFYNKKNGACSR